jgi:GR25 family glycosyltransferase involved in LPS biosynthesis
MGKIHKQNADYVGTTIANLYRAYLQRETDEVGSSGYRIQTYGEILHSLKNSVEYQELCFKKQNAKIVPLNKKISYTVIKIDNRSDETLKLLHDELKEKFTYCDNLKFIDGRTENIQEFFDSRKIKINWCADLFSLKKETSTTELAIIASHMVIMEYLLNSDIDEIVVFEDDVKLQNNAVNILTNCINDLPNNYDFMADTTYEPHYEELSTVEYSIITDSNYICRSFLQNAHTGFMIYSKKGAENIINLYKKYGVMCAIDTFLFWMSRRGDLQGYTTYYSSRIISYKDFLGTLVENKRT